MASELLHNTHSDMLAAHPDEGESPALSGQMPLTHGFMPNQFTNHNPHAIQGPTAQQLKFKVSGVRDKI